jgi:tetratricopeptide (TPR) repeat protein
LPVVNAVLLTTQQKAQLDLAVSKFRDHGPICVTPQKLSAFLEETRDIEAPPAQRLRWLAIALENGRLERGWDGLRAIYRAAAEADPDDFRILHSWGLSASNWASSHVATPDLDQRKAIADEAERVLHAALELSPRDSRVAHALGLLFYNRPSSAEDPDEYQSRAIDWFSRAIEWDPGNAMAQLYLAHCFHDRKDWPRAILEYEKVDLERLARDWPAWRAVKCREQLAHCYAYAGHTGEAIRRFDAFLDNATRWGGEEAEKHLINVDELVDAVTHPLDDPELLRRTRELVQRLVQNPRMRWLAKRYEQLFLP